MFVQKLHWFFEKSYIEGIVNAIVDGDVVAETVHNARADLDEHFWRPLHHDFVAYALFDGLHLRDYQVPLALRVEGELVDDVVGVGDSRNVHDAVGVVDDSDLRRRSGEVPGIRVDDVAVFDQALIDDPLARHALRNRDLRGEATARTDGHAGEDVGHWRFVVFGRFLALRIRLARWKA